MNNSIKPMVSLNPSYHMPNKQSLIDKKKEALRNILEKYEGEKTS